MYIIRPAQPSDLDIMLKLARTVHFINLPADKDIIAEKIARSRTSFRAATSPDQQVTCGASDRSATASSPIFMFVLADAKTDACVGTSMIIAKMGTPGHPNVSFSLSKREFFSTDLQSGATHTVAKLYLDESGMTEIGGLIVGPSLRGHPEKLGKQLSMIRFHYIGLRRDQFADRVLAEMMAPITADGRNVFWEHLGRRFINLSYVEADVFCQHSREFMTSLLPREEIYMTLLPPNARKGIAQVGRDTIPARRMLEGLGFAYTGRIDPFDGGPHLECDTAEISVVRHTRSASFGGVCGEAEADQFGFVSVDDTGSGFRAVHSAYRVDADGVIHLPEPTAAALRLEASGPVGLTPFDLRKPLAHRATGPVQAAPASPAQTDPKRTHA